MGLRFITLISVVALLASCAGRVQQSQSTFLPGMTSSSAGSTRSTAGKTGTLVIRVRVPAHPDFISPSTKGMSVQIAGPTNVKEAVGLTLSAKGCKSSLMTISCQLTIPNLDACPTNHHCYTATVATYDAFNASRNKIPHHAHRLSAEQSFAFAITSGNNLIPLVLEGIPASVAFIPNASSSLVGTQTSGFVEPKCTASAQKVTVLGVDADGNYILGAGAPKVSIASSDAAQLSVAKAAEPNTFSLRPPSAPGYPFGNFTIHLSVTVKPGNKSGGVTKTAAVNVAYSGNICGVVTEFAVPTAGSGPYGITGGPDGNVWFTEEIGNHIGRITPAGSIAEYSVLTASAAPIGITAGPDGNLWFSEHTADKIGKITTGGVVATEYPVPTAAAAPFGITAGPDGNLWFTEQNGNKIASITTAGTVTEYTIPTSSSDSIGITAGPDGALWFAEFNGNNIGRVTTAGSFSTYALPVASSHPVSLAKGANGALWFTEFSANTIADVTTSGSFPAAFGLPEASSVPTFAATGPDGAVWVTESTGNRIARITAAGAITEFAVPTGAAQPFGITLGPDGAIWFTELNGNKIGRLR